MTDRAGLPTAVNEAIAVDEIGIEAGIFGAYRLKSAYRPIFRRDGDALVPIAVEGEIAPHLQGRPISPELFFAQIAPEHAFFIENMCLALHVRNRRNIGIEALDLHFKYDPRALGGPQKSLADVRLLAELLAAIELDPQSVVVEIVEPASLEPSVLWRLAAAMRDIGVRLAIDGFGAEPATQETFDLLKPNVFKIDGARLLRLRRDAATARLVALLVSSIRERGTKLLVADINDAAQMRAALAVDADLFFGDHLAPAALVGTVFNEPPLSITGLMASEPKVLRFIR